MHALLENIYFASGIDSLISSFPTRYVQLLLRTPIPSIRIAVPNQQGFTANLPLSDELHKTFLPCSPITGGDLSLRYGIPHSTVTLGL